MNTLKMMALALLALAVVPGVASATHFNEVAVWGDCQGWTAQVEINWRTGIYSGNVDYTIRLMDGNTVLEEHSWAGILGRNLGDPQDITYTFQGPWSGAHSGVLFTITGVFHVVSPWDGGIDDQTVSYSADFQCAVASESSTWSTIKSLYR
jgi:hypothetical protein